MQSQYKQYMQLLAMSVFSFGTQLLGVVRTSLVGRTFGASSAYDSYVVATAICTTVFAFVTSATSTIVIPRLAQHANKRQTDAFLTMLYVMACGLAAVIWLFRELIMRLMPHHDEQFVSMGSCVLGLLALASLLNFIFSIATAYLQVHNRFVFPSFFTFVPSLVLVVCLLIDTSITVYRFALYMNVSTVVGAAIITVYAAVRGYRITLVWTWRRDNIAPIVRQFLPTMLSVGVYQLSTVIDTLISSRLGVGYATLLNYAIALSSVITVLINTNLTNFAYPKIATAFGISASRGLHTVGQYSYAFVAACIYAMAVTLSCGMLALRILFGSHALSAQELSVIYWCSVILLCGSVFDAIRGLVYRAFFSVGDTKSPFYNGIVASIVNITISLAASTVIGIYGVVLGTACTTVVSMATALYRLHKRIPFAAGKLWQFAAHYALIAVAGVIACLTTLWIPMIMSSLILTACVRAAVITVIFAGLLIIVRSPVLRVRF